MSRHSKSILLATAALTMMSAAALADPITYAGTFSITDTSPANNNALTVTSDPTGFSIPLSLGQKVDNITLATFHTSDTSKAFASYASDTIRGTFDFTKPVTESNSVNGSVSEVTAYAWGHFSSSGILLWNTNDLDVSFSDGSKLDIDLGPSLFANLNGTSDAQVVSANFTLTKEPVPEPASIALLGGGLFGLGLLGKRRRSQSGIAV